MRDASVEGPGRRMGSDLSFIERLALVVLFLTAGLALFGAITTLGFAWASGVALLLYGLAICVCAVAGSTPSRRGKVAMAAGLLLATAGPLVDPHDAGPRRLAPLPAVILFFLAVSWVVSRPRHKCK